MLETPRLGAPAYQYGHVSLQYQWPNGWTVTVSTRREGTSAYEVDQYGDLSTDEAFDAVSTSLAHFLGL